MEITQLPQLTGRASIGYIVWIHGGVGVSRSTMYKAPPRPKKENRLCRRSALSYSGQIDKTSIRKRRMANKYWML